MTDLGFKARRSNDDSGTALFIPDENKTGFLVALQTRTGGVTNSNSIDQISKAAETVIRRVNAGSKSC